MAIKAILFDLWGTLTYNKSEQAFWDVEDLITEKLGKSYKDKLYRINTTKEQLIHDMKTLVSYKESRKLDALIRKNEENARLYTDVVPVLTELQKEYKLGIISNTNALSKEEMLKLGLDKFMDIMVFSCDIGDVKPYPKIFSLAIKQLNLKSEECLYVGDQIDTDVNGAKNSGLNAMLIDRKNRYPEIEDKIKDLNGLDKMLKTFE